MRVLSNDQVLKCESDLTGEIKRSVDHYHDFLELYYLVSGECNCLIEDTLFQLSAGDIMIIPPRLIHQSSYKTSRHARLLLHCSYHYFPSLIYDLTAQKSYVYRNLHITSDAFAILSRIEQELQHQDTFTQELIKSYLYQFFVLLSRNPNQYKNNREGNLYIKKILNEVHLNYDSDISLADFACRGSVSREHLSRLFKSETGISFQEYLISLRLKNAQELLVQKPKWKISQVAYSCGFHDSNYFSGKFKQAYGLSPYNTENDN